MIYPLPTYFVYHFLTSLSSLYNVPLIFQCKGVRLLAINTINASTLMHLKMSGWLGIREKTRSRIRLWHRRGTTIMICLQGDGEQSLAYTTWWLHGVQNLNLHRHIYLHQWKLKTWSFISRAAPVLLFIQNGNKFDIPFISSWQCRGTHHHQDFPPIIQPTVLHLPPPTMVRCHSTIAGVFIFFLIEPATFLIAIQDVFRSKQPFSWW